VGGDGALAVRAAFSGATWVMVGIVIITLSARYCAGGDAAPGVPTKPKTLNNQPFSAILAS